MKKSLLFALFLVLSTSAFAMNRENRFSAIETDEEKSEKLEVQKKLFVPWRQLNLFELHKKTLEEVISEQNEEKDEEQFSSQELEQQGVSNE